MTMLKRFLAAFLAAVCSLSWPLAALAAPVVVHQPVLEAQAGRAITVNVTVTDQASSVTRVRLYFRRAGSLSFREEIMRGTGLNYTAAIPGSAVTLDGLEYYIEAQNQAGEKGSSPQLNPVGAPHRVLVRKPAGPPALELLSPEDRAQVAPGDVVIVVRLDAGTSRIDLNTLKVLLDEKDVTPDAQKSTTLISYVPPADLASGLHSIRITVRNMEGAEAKSPTWSFTVTTPEKAAAWKAEKGEAPSPGAFRGSLRAEMRQASLTKEPQTVLYLAQPEGWLHRLNLNFTWGDDNWKLLGTTYLTSEETPGQQPVNRFRFDIVNPLLSVSLGDTYPVFTDLSLNNIFTRGATLRWVMGDINQGHSELHLAVGLNRVAIEGRGTDLVPELAGTFERWIGGFRWVTDFIRGIGFSLNVSGVGDNTESLEITAGALPELNGVLTGEGHVKIDYLPDFFSVFYGEYGFSGYGENLNVFASALDTAYLGGMRWEWDNRNVIDLAYRHVSPSFENLSNPWLISDWEGVESEARISLMGDDLILLAEMDIWRDNLKGQKTVDTEYYIEASNTTVTVTADTINTSYLSGLAYYRLPFYLTTLSLGYSVNSQKDASAPFTIIDTQTSVLNLGLGTQIPAGMGQVMGNLTYSLIGYQDLAEVRLSGDFQTSSFFLSAMYLHGSDWSLAAGFGLNSTKTEESQSLLASYGSDQQTIDYTLFNLRGNWKAIPSQLDVGLSWESMSGKDDLGVLEDVLSTVALSSTYYLSSSQSLGLTLSSIGYANQLVSTADYAEFVMNLLYSLTF